MNSDDQHLQAQCHQHRQYYDHISGLSGVVLPKQVQYQERICHRGGITEYIDFLVT